MLKYRFNDIAINSTAKKKPEDSDKYTYIGLEHLDPQCLEVTRFGSEIAPIGDKLLMKKGDVLFGKRRAYQKKVAIAPFDGIFSAHGLVLRPKEDVITKEFFPFFISSDYFLDKAIEISVGSLSPTINWSDLKELEFNIPDLDTQRKIAPILWAFNTTKNAYLTLLDKMNHLVNSQFIEMLDSCNNIEIMTLNNYVQWITKSSLRASDGSDKGLYPFYTSSTEQNKWSDSYIYDNECLILGNGGTASINYHEGKFSATSHNYVFTSKDKNKYLLQYIYQYLNCNIDILERGFKGVGLKNISREYVENIKIKMPLVNNQRKIISAIQLIDKSKFEIEKALEKLKIAQKSILDDVFSD